MRPAHAIISRYAASSSPDQFFDPTAAPRVALVTATGERHAIRRHHEFRPRVAVIGGGISGMAAGAFLRAVGDRDALRGRAAPRRPRPHGPGRSQRRAAGRYRLHRLQLRHLSAPRPAVPRARRARRAQRHELRRQHRRRSHRVRAARRCAALFAQPATPLRPGFLRMLRDIQRFNAAAEAPSRDGPDDRRAGRRARPRRLVPALLPRADLRRDLVDPRERDRGAFPPAPRCASSATTGCSA